MHPGDCSPSRNVVSNMISRCFFAEEMVEEEDVENERRLDDSLRPYPERVICAHAKTAQLTRAICRNPFLLSIYIIFTCRVFDFS